MKRLCFIALIFLLSNSIYSQQNKKKKKKVPPPFKWVNPIPENKKSSRVFHKTFKSSSMGVEVGYCIYLPSEYDYCYRKTIPRCLLPARRPAGQRN